MFKDVNSLPDYPKLEEGVLEYWKKNNIQKKVDETRFAENIKSGGKKERVYYDGPITANNFPHYGHVITWTMKDVIPRYWTMKGYYVQRNMGWDCQGIPVEIEVEKKLGFKNKSEVEKYGVSQFNKLCRESVMEYRDAMIKYESRFGRWMDLANAYSTMDSKYIESMWWSIKELSKKGYLYEGHKVVPYSTGAGTQLSDAEVDVEPYKEIIDTSVFVKFNLNYYKTGFGACVVIENEKGEVLMAIRKEPNRDTVYGVVGGKADTETETPLEVAKREALEEIGVLPENLEVVGSSIDVFEGRLFHTYHVKGFLPSSSEFKKVKELGEFKWVKKNEIPWDKMHIPTRNGMQDILKIKDFDKIETQKPKVYVVAWTTTPWTLPGNLMLSVGKGLKYSLLKTDNNEYLIVASEMIEKVFAELDTLENVKSFNVVDEFDAKELVNNTYTPIFPHFAKKVEEGAFKVIYADHVSLDSGSGIVHLAPYGAEDFEIFRGLNISLFDYLDDVGNFTELIPEYRGLFYKKANKEIVEYLKQNSLLLKVNDYAHMMPMCWRTKVPLIYKPLKSWYIAVSKLKAKLIAENKDINWVPEHLKEGKVGVWLENAKDWALSRFRYWGTPLPVWVNDKTGEQVIIGSFKELSEISGKNIDEKFDPHRPYVDDIIWTSKDGGTFRRVKDVIDVWYDSGSMCFAQFHYPFENKDIFEKRFPADYISEMHEQCRLWFYTMMVINNAIFDKNPFKNVIAVGVLGAEDGKKLSKSLGNYPPMEEMTEKYGSDIFRYLILSSPLVEAGTARFSYKFLDEAKKEFFTTLWNSYRYFVTYANLYNFKYDENVVKNIHSDSSNVLDKWILVRFNELSKKVNNAMESYHVLEGTKELAPFIEDLSTWYIRRSRDRLSEGDSVALNVLHYVLLEFTKLIAPFVPLISDEIYQNLASVQPDEFETVHLANFPKYSEFSEYYKSILSDMWLTKQIASAGNSIRKAQNIPVKQPLSEMFITIKGTSQSAEIDLTSKHLDLLKDELNVKKVTILPFNDFSIVEKEKNLALFDINLSSSGTNFRNTKWQNLTVSLDIELTEDLMIEAASRELIREIQKLRKETNVAWDAKIKVQFISSVEYLKAVEKFEKDIKKKTLSLSLTPGDSLKIIV